MPVYQYKGFKESTGGQESGIIDADSPREARTKLRQQKIFVSELQPMQEIGGDPASGASRKLSFKRAKLVDLAVATRQLGTLLNAGIPLMESLSALIDQAENEYLEATMRDVRERIARGEGFAESLAYHPKWFDDLFCAMVRAGEASGNLDTVLIRMADFLQAQARLRGRVMAALTYPMIMCVIGFGVISFLMAFVVPRITKVLVEQQGLDALPLPTEILLIIQNALLGYWWLLAGVFAVLVATFIGWKRTERGRFLWDSMKLNAPVVGILFRKQAVSRFSSTMATLLESGLPVLEALDVVGDVVDNAVMKDALINVRKKVTEGSDISAPLKASKVFPPVVGYMVAIGEESGSLDHLLRKIAESYDEEIEITAAKVTAFLEPVLIVGLAAIVGFIVLAILMPILQISNIGSWR
jgi:general secretion pathway protein F